MVTSLGGVKLKSSLPPTAPAASGSDLVESLRCTTRYARALHRTACRDVYKCCKLLLSSDSQTSAHVAYQYINRTSSVIEHPPTTPRSDTLIAALIAETDETRRTDVTLAMRQHRYLSDLFETATLTASQEM